MTMRIPDRKSLQQVQRVVVKIGTRALSTPGGRLSLAVIHHLVSQIAAIKQNGTQCILVSSGAIGSGMGELGIRHRPQDMLELQALASIGQTRLMHTYADAFRKHRFHVGQILLTRQDFEDRRRYLNVRNTLLALLKIGAVPIVNENDATAVDEVMSIQDPTMIGDNDLLSAMLTSLIEADALIILSDIPGVFDRAVDTRGNAQTRNILHVVHHIDPTVERLAYTRSSRGGKGGGMTSKLAAAKLAVSHGEPVVIACARQKNILRRILHGEDVGTFFAPSQSKRPGRKRWLSFNNRIKGKILVDQGAMDALLVRKKSLLPSGILRAEGSFSKGDLVIIADRRGREIARGLANYAVTDVMKIRGRNTADIRNLLGHAPYHEVVHRDNLVVTCST